MSQTRTLRLRAARRMAGYTQDDLAKLVEVAPSTIRRWENGETQPYPYHLAKVCRLLHTTPEQLGFSESESSLEEEAEAKGMPTILIPNPDPEGARKQTESPSTYIVAETNEDELYRLNIQDTLTTQQMQGVLSEQKNVETIRNLLDVACGTGGWLIETAKTYPAIEQLVGIDISNKMIDHAQIQAKKEGVSNRVQFRVMDALRLLEFSDASFDLVNQRFGMSFLRIWDWPKILKEYHRILVPNGILRITEADVSSSEESSSTALLRLNALFGEAFLRGGYSFTEKGITDHIASLLEQYGYRNVQSRYRVTEFHAETEQGKLFIENMEKLYRNAKPFLSKWVKLPEDFDRLYQQLVQELHEPNFFMKGKLLTVWGTPRRG